MASVSRVLMTADARGGVWTYALELSRELGEHGVEVLLAIMGGGVTSEKLAQAAKLPNVQLQVSEYKLEWMESPWEEVEDAGHWLRRLADSFRPDVVHLNGYAHAALPWDAPVLVVAHSCVLSWFDAVRKHPAPSQWAAYREAVTRGIAAADVVVAPSAFMLHEIERHYGKPVRSRVIYNGRNSHLFRPAAKEPFIFSAGRLWDDAKNIGVLAQCASELLWPLYLAGESGKDLPSSVHALGVIAAAQMPNWYGRAAIYAHPALYEPFGLAVLEAALAGCTLVLGDIPPLREIWGGAAIYVDPLDPDAWRAELNRLAQNPIDPTAARTRALQLNSASMARQYMDAYQQLLRHPSCVSHSSAIPSAPTGIMETPISSAA